MYLISATIVTIYLLIIRNRIKLNIKSLFILTLTGISFLYLLNDFKKISYIQMDSSEEISKIWHSYSNQKLMHDVQLTRSLNPNSITDDKVVKPNQVITDNKNIFSISGNQVFITDINDLKVLKKITYEKNFKPLFLYVENDKLVVIGESNNKTICYIYNKKDFTVFKQFSIDATYVTSRIIDDELYLITSRIIDKNKQERPSYTENNIIKYIPYQNIFYVNGTYSNNYVNVIKTNINSKEQFRIISYLGLGQVIYISPDNIYIAEEKYDKDTGNSGKSIIIKIDNEKLVFSSMQEIPGYVLDEHSLSEYKGYLRIATTTHDENDLVEGNNIYILNDEMNLVGKLENISKGNEIQAAVFIKDKAYIETFNILDPFYVIDLANERKPKVISEIKFDGYNTSFVPYDEKRLIAFGLVLDNDKKANGLKVSLYDVSNPDKVKILSKDTIMYKDYNSAYSEVLYDGKSLLLDRDKGILGFPIIYWINEADKPAYYKQFYAVYKINNDLTNIGKISHYEIINEQNESNDIKRGLIINNYLYTVSDKLIKINDIPNLKLIKKGYLK